MIISNAHKFDSVNMRKLEFSHCDFSENHNDYIKWSRVDSNKFYFLPNNKIPGQFIINQRSNFVLVYELSDDFHEEIVNIDPNYQINWTHKNTEHSFVNVVDINGSDDLMLYLKMRF